MFGVMSYLTFMALKSKKSSEYMITIERLSPVTFVNRFCMVLYFSAIDKSQYPKVM